jgi:hypothetical protein
VTAPLLFVARVTDFLALPQIKKVGQKRCNLSSDLATSHASAGRAANAGRSR